ncbi:MAG: hypothetical protein ACE5HK_03755 [Candidatus Methylomirabilales bacterium]
MDKGTEQAVRQRLLDIVARDGKVTERELLRISAMTGVDYLTVSRTLEEIVVRRWTESRPEG